METHRYARRSRPRGTFDSYNSLSSKFPDRHSKLEYWTNGNVTLMSTPPPPEAAAAAATMGETVLQFAPRQLTTAASPPSHSTKIVPAAAPPANRESHVVRNSIIAGSLAGIASTSTFYPFDVLRTKMQSAAAHESSSSTTSSSSAKARALAVHRTPFQVLVHTLQNGGVRALYTGLSLPVTAQAVYKATVFSVNKVTTKALTEWKTQERRKVGDFTPVTLSMADRFFCGFCGGAINAALFVTPVEFVRNQLIAQHTRKAHGLASPVHFAGPRDVIRHTVSTQGISGLWKGATMAVSRDAIGCGCFFYTFHFLSQRLPQDQASSTLLAGAASGLAFWMAALPLDTVKTWVQNGSATSGRDAIVESVSEHGIVYTAQRLCRGYQVALGRGMPAAAVTVTTYEAVSRYLERHCK